MKKYNLEEQLAHKLGNRSIDPSDEAWGRIAFNRQQQAGNQQKKKRGFYMIAAALLLFLAGGYFVGILLKTENTSQETPQVVLGVKPEKALQPDAVVVSESFASVVRDKQVGATVPVLLPKHEADRQENNPVTNITEIPVEMHMPEVVTNEQVIKPTTPVIAETRPQEDVLLEKAMHDVAMEKQRKATTNDTALLKEVETEMDEYYREKALRFFSLKYKKIRIVVKDNH